MTRPGLRHCLLGVAGVLAAALDAFAMPTFQGATPPHWSSSADPAPTISVEVTDAVAAIDPSSIQLSVAGEDVSGGLSLVPIPSGYRLVHVPPSPFNSGQLVDVEARATSLDGTASSGWAFHIHLTYPAGTLVIDMNSGVIGANDTFDGYGVVMELARRGYPVNWLIRQSKSYGGDDFTALVDDRPKLDPGPDGRVGVLSHQGGPFLLPDPDPTTPFNEVWTTLTLLKQSLNMDPRLHELQEPLALDFNDVFYVTYRPRIAVSDVGSAVTELDLALIPHSLVEAPGELDEAGSVAGGGLFLPATDAICGRARAYDFYIQSHHSWNDTQPEARAAIDELDEFLAKAGMAVFECESASIENYAHWITEPGYPIVEGSALGPVYAPDPSRYGHPFLQTMGSIPIEPGAFPIWDRELNYMRPNMQNILVEPVSQDVGYVFGAVGSGKVYYMGGHTRSAVSDRRLVLNSVLYSATYPKYDRNFAPQVAVVDEDNVVDVEIIVTGGSSSMVTVLEDRFDPSTQFIEGSLDLRVPRATHSYDRGTNTLQIELGDIHPLDYPGGVLGNYQVLTHPTSSGPISLLNHASRYRDAWGADYVLDTVGCGDVHSGPRFEINKTTDTATVLSAQTTRVRLRLVARNNHTLTPLHDVVLTDGLPAAVSFVPGSIRASRGDADWGLAALDKLTWRVGDLPPEAVAMLTFDVDVAPVFPTALLLNDGVHGEARDVTGTLIKLTSGNVFGRAYALGTGPHLDFSLSPDLTAGGETPYTFCVMSRADNGNFIRTGDAVILTFPQGFSELKNLVPGGQPGDWTGTWEPASRSLRLRTATGLGVGESICFDFDLVTTRRPGLYTVDASAIFEDLWFQEDLPVVVVHEPSLMLPPDALLQAQPCESLVHPWNVSNLGNGGDVFEVEVSTAEARTVTLYVDENADGLLDPGDSVVGDSNGNGVPDTGAVGIGANRALLLVVEVDDLAGSVGDTITVQVTSVADPALLKVMTVAIELAPLSVDIGPDAPSTCAGVDLSLDAGPGYASYEWTTGERTQTITVALLSTTSFGVTAASVYGCLRSATETVTVLPTPAPVITASSAELCSGGSATLDAGPGYANYLWSTAEASQSVVVAPATTTTYSVMVTNGSGCLGRADATITVLPGPTTDAGPNWLMCPGEAAVLGSPPTAGGTYAWTPVTGLDDPNAAQPTASPAATTTYTLTVTSAMGCAATSTTTVTVAAGPHAATLGNVLRLARVARDLWHIWEEPDGLNEVRLYSSGSKATSVDLLASIAPGTGSYRLIGAIDGGEPVVYYRLGADTCRPVAVP